MYKVLAIKIAQSAVVVGLTLVLLEISVRFLLPQNLPTNLAASLHVPDPIIGWKRVKNARSLVNTGERDVWICTDKNGDRIDCERTGAHKCRLRALVLGNSFVEALSIPYRETVWGRLEVSQGLCAAVAGVGAYYPGQYVIQTRQRLQEPEDKAFSMVILNLQAGSDFVDNIEWMPDASVVSLPDFFVYPRGISKKDLAEWFAPVNKRLETKSHAYVAVRNLLRDIIDPERVTRMGIPPGIRKSEFTNRRVNETTRAVELIAGMAAVRNIPLVVVVIPNIMQVLDPKGVALMDKYPLLQKDIDMDMISERLVPAIRGVRGVADVVDMLPCFRESADRSYWGTLDPHLSPKGHELWFRCIERSLSKL